MCLCACVHVCGLFVLWILIAWQENTLHNRHILSSSCNVSYTEVISFFIYSLQTHAVCDKGVLKQSPDPKKHFPPPPPIVFLFATRVVVRKGHVMSCRAFGIPARIVVEMKCYITLDWKTYVYSLRRFQMIIQVGIKILYYVLIISCQQSKTIILQMSCYQSKTKPPLINLFYFNRENLKKISIINRNYRRIISIVVATVHVTLKCLIMAVRKV